ncbi:MULTISPECIES: cell division ATP-binding protein FtsE [unclassified Pyramidobacter]|uniref:cell division ATP-binding protein FtsE n=1 Tax=unclassified Pyramidobacter TaxID=2632171 RepID=UPI0025D47E2E|nr:MULTISPECIES: ATP-binding cassette domain-containing protein [unclassified Pyramidobacter]MCI7403674.1 ATP-binding cassette domain-containing protein [Pyramidobacter sp.]MDY3212995.1 ATP-binding cassette domain-containing protein [Pyramidobacter sp.]WOL39220.1 ATP-binding cassette domain-containing protein [Pyramidobacter sp. YE332]
MEIHINGLTKIFPPNILALSDIYLDISEGEFVYLIGTTGSGKTTLMRMLTREVLPTRGQVSLDGIDLRRLSSSSLPYFRRDIGVVFQDYKLLPNLTAWENVAFVLEVCGVPRAEARERTDDVIDKVGLWNRRGLMPDQLSGGEQQRVAIARAIVNAPRLFLADEPTGNLDVHTAEYVMKLLLSIHAAGTTVIVATHDQHLVDTYRQRVVELHMGRLVRDEREGRYSISGDL